MRLGYFLRYFSTATKYTHRYKKGATMQNIFVYGTLTTGQPNHYFMFPKTEAEGQCKLLGRARTVDRYPLVVAGRCYVPYLLDARGKGKHVEGEVYSVDEVMLKTLDELEGHPTYYQRDKIEVKLIDNPEDRPDCMAYFLRDYKKELESLPTLETFDVNSGQGKYIPPKERSKEASEKQMGDVKVMK